MPDTTNNPYVTTTNGMRGYFAVLMTWNENCGGFYEPYNTGLTCKDYKDAVDYAKSWAIAENIEYKQ